jgi:hypothetical protein
MSAPRRRRDKTELREASEHLYYELWMLNRIGRLLAMGAFGDGPVKNACLESFTIHARALRQFFFPTKAQPDDVLAEDYFADRGAWEAVRGEMPTSLAPINSRVGKEVAHLTYARLSVSDVTKAWSFISIAEDLDRIAVLFRGHVDSDLLGQRFRNEPAPAA